MIEHSLQAWATALGVDRKTLETRLVKAGYNPEKRGKLGGEKLTARKIVDAMVGDKSAAKTRLDEANARRVERENLKDENTLYSRAGIEQLLWSDLLKPLRERILAYPKTHGVKLRTFMSAHRVSKDVADRTCDIACAGVAELIDFIRKVRDEK